VAVDSEVLFPSLVQWFSLTIAFRVISRSEVESHVQCISEGPEEVRHKFVSMIRGDMAWDTILGEEVENKEL